MPGGRQRRVGDQHVDAARPASARRSTSARSERSAAIASAPSSAASGVSTSARRAAEHELRARARAVRGRAPARARRSRPSAARCAPATFIVLSSMPIITAGTILGGMSRQDVIALFGPTARRQDRGGDRARPDPAGARGGPGGGLRRRAAGLPGPRDPHRRRDAAERAELEHRLISFLPVDAQFSAGQYAELAHNEIDELLAAGPPADRRRRNRALPARRARGPVAAAAAARRRAGALDCRSSRATARRRCTRVLAAARAMGGCGDRPDRQPPDRARARASTRPASSSRPAANPSCGRGRRAIRHCWSASWPSASASTRRSTRASTRCSRPAWSRRCGAPRSGRSERHGTQGARLRRAAGRRRRGDEAPHPQLRAAPADLDAQAPGRAAARRHRSEPRRRSPPRSPSHWLAPMSAARHGRSAC